MVNEKFVDTDTWKRF